MKMTQAELTAFLDSEFPQMRPLKFRIEHWDGTMLRLAMPIAEQNLRPGGTVSGPAMMTLADCAAYMLLLGLIGPVALAVTTNLNINFLRKPEPEPLECTCRILKLGKRLAVLDASIVKVGDDDLVAHATATYSIPPR